MVYKINKHTLLEEFGYLDYSPKKLDPNGFVMSAMKNRANHGRPEYKDEPIGPKFSEPAKIPGYDNHTQALKHNNPLDQHTVNSSEPISSLGH